MTDKQKQCCLAALGLYPANLIDGIWGAKSREAEIAFREAFPGKTLGGAVAELEKSGDFWGKIRYFQRQEFVCRCGGKFCGGFPAEPGQTLVELLDDLRSRFGAPAHITSGVRCTRHNAAVGGVVNSRHLEGRAADFFIEGISGEALLAAAKGDSRTRYAYLIGSGPCIHVDV